ncbi:hypothetical protein P11VFA_004 [Rhizobium phage P11VFA]|nr:hypothetical protein P11VFA_004 [Rhizobium phage P11VFA]
MKLFMILYTMGQIGGTAGPLPYDINECKQRAAALQANVTQIVATGRSTNGKNEEVGAEDMEKFKTMRFSCEHRASKPELGEKEPSI